MRVVVVRVVGRMRQKLLQLLLQLLLLQLHLLQLALLLQLLLPLLVLVQQQRNHLAPLCASSSARITWDRHNLTSSRKKRPLTETSCSSTRPTKTKASPDTARRPRSKSCTRCATLPITLCFSISREWATTPTSASTTSQSWYS